ncbi:MAG: hypothetical protein J7J32_05955, partial [Candidatus Atribacteria bacterium]|nr:hypothetical protein [Candidatus Atribacteria bacterium]MCD6349346.1 hypothetical protein [Candidatus Atribacteria bacterium]
VVKSLLRFWVDSCLVVLQKVMMEASAAVSVVYKEFKKTYPGSLTSHSFQDRPKPSSSFPIFAIPN